MAEKYGLSPAGFKRKRLPEIIADLNKRVSEQLGIEIQTNSNSVFGQLHGVYGYELAAVWEQLENIYNAMYPTTAVGESLSNAAGLAGIKQIAAEKTQLIVICYGIEGTEIPYKSRISSSKDSNLVFDCSEVGARITADNAARAVVGIENDVADGITYTLTINGRTEAYTASSGDSKSIVLTNLYNRFAYTGLLFNLEDDVLSISAPNINTRFVIMAENIAIAKLGTAVKFLAVDAGAINPGLGTVNNIVDIQAGWDSCENIYNNVGRDAETDIALRRRWGDAVYHRSIGMTDSIAAAIMTNCDGVTASVVYENDTDTEDEQGRPPHSVEAVVAGGVVEDIAAELWRTKAAGIDTFGSVAVEVSDSQGIPHTMNFNRPEIVPVYLKVVISENPEESLPMAAENEVVAAIVGKGEEQKIGQDVILQRYFAAIFAATPGIGYINITASTDGVTYSSTNIEINPRQVASITAARIEVSRV